MCVYMVSIRPLLAAHGSLKELMKLAVQNFRLMIERTISSKIKSTLILKEFIVVERKTPIVIELIMLND
jgi:hypothetical protein